MALKSYKELLKSKMIQKDHVEFSGFKDKIGKGFTDKDLDVVYRLHAKYLNHNFNIPCGCGGARKIDTINAWIKDLVQIHDNGVQS